MVQTAIMIKDIYDIHQSDDMKEFKFVSYSTYLECILSTIVLKKDIKINYTRNLGDLLFVIILIE